VGLALPHQLWTGQEFLASPAASVYWWSLWAAAAGAVLVWRVGLPLWRNARHRLRVTAVTPEADGVVSVYLAGHRLDRLPAEAGQFFTWRFLNRQGWTRGNPYSLSAAPDGRGLRITVKELGNSSAQVRALRPGTPVLFEGPFGRLTARRRGPAAPVHRPAPVRARLHLLVFRRGLQVLWLPGHRRAAGSWLGDGIGPADDVTALRWWVPDLAERDVYVCGPEDWVDTVRGVTLAAGLPPEQLHVEKFRW
jgi:ferredoxin-NADP reductase